MALRRSFHPAPALFFLVPALLGWAAAAPPALGAQQPADTTGVAVPDGPAADTLDGGLPPDTLEAEVREVRNLPDHPAGARPSFTTGVWEWEGDEILSARALTLLELVEEISGVVALKGGDYGQPQSATAFGLGGGRVRVFLDGVEMPPLDGGVVDLSRVGLGGVGRVRVERRPGELRIELTPLRLTDPRPFTLLEVGTGDLNTNLFRGTFAHPFAFGGGLNMSLDRIDTEGRFRDEPGVSFGAHLRHTLLLGERGGLAWEVRHRTSRRPEEIWPVASVGRTDLAAHARLEVVPGIIAGAFYQRSALSAEEGGAGKEGVVAPVDEEPQTGAGIFVSATWGRGWAEAEARSGWGRGLASSAQSLRAGVDSGLGGLSVSVERERWAGDALVDLHGRIWTAPLWGLSLFGEVASGRRGVRLSFSPPEEGEEPEDPADPEPAPEPGEAASVTDRTGYRGGLEARVGDLSLGVAGLWVSADSLHPTGLPPDRDGVVTAGGERAGVEAVARIPLTPLLGGLALAGGAQFWEGGPEWRYLPRTTYQGGVHFHDVFLVSGNLEVWADVGVRGRDPMRVPLSTEADPTVLQTVPFQQSWFARVQVRVVSARIFVVWENFTLREINQDYPGRLLPQTRALYGVRWTLWN